MVLLNYVVTILFSYFQFNVNLANIPENLPYTLVLALGFLLPSIFVVQYFSIVYSGIIRTDIAQRMSLFIPIVAAITIFNEQISTQRYFALFIGLLSVYLILKKSSNQNQELTIQTKNYSTLFPLLTFIGFGVIDILFKQLALYSEIPYTSSLFYVFSTAFVLSLVYYIAFKLKNKENILTISKSTVLYGLILGTLNFINIAFYMKAHQVFRESPTTVFAGMNFGVIILGTLVGYFFFKEKLSKLNLIGLGLVILSILVILL
ncbi:EamA/RhaT family transporter [Myroides pelagicus]|nr:EamA/RhaT family transporter [Myroides pelagicus]MEC4114603.1 EamA/RhaT family transporter [Myroides pelagicus]